MMKRAKDVVCGCHGDGLESINVDMHVVPRKKCVFVAEAHWVNVCTTKHLDLLRRKALKIGFSQLFCLRYLEGFPQSIPTTREER